MSSTMNKWEMAAHGRENLLLRDAVVPAPKAGEVLVRVGAVSLNYRDKLVFSGGAGASFTAPLTPASDMAGTIVELGEGASRFAIVDRVISTFLPEWVDGLPPGDAKTPPHRTLGGFFQGILAQYVVFPQSWLVHAPESLGDMQASTLPCAGLTAWFAFVERGGVKEGDIVLVEGTGGVAVFGLQIAEGFNRLLMRPTGCRSCQLHWITWSVVASERSLSIWSVRKRQGGMLSCRTVQPS